MRGIDARQTHPIVRRPEDDGWRLHRDTSLFVIDVLEGTQVLEVAPDTPFSFYQTVVIHAVAVGGSLTLTLDNGDGAGPVVVGSVFSPSMFLVTHYVQNERQIHFWGGGGSGGSLPPYSGNPSAALVENSPGGPAVWRQLYAEEILERLAVTLTPSMAGVYEIGANTPPASFNATYKRGLDDQSGALLFCEVEDNRGGPVVDLLAVALPDTRLSFMYAPGAGTVYTTTSSGAAANNQSATWTISAKDVGSVVSTVTTARVRWQPRVYNGPLNHPAGVEPPLTEALVKSLSSSLKASRQGTFTHYLGHNDFMYWAAPATYGTPTFWVGGFAGGYQHVGDVLVTTDTDNPVTQLYAVWRSDNDNLKTQVVTVT